ncbi:hypothetical protein GCM10009818_31220 [Nakamurella flavida]
MSGRITPILPDMVPPAAGAEDAAEEDADDEPEDIAEDIPDEADETADEAAEVAEDTALEAAVPVLPPQAASSSEPPASTQNAAEVLRRMEFLSSDTPGERPGREVRQRRPRPGDSARGTRGRSGRRAGGTNPTHDPDDAEASAIVGRGRDGPGQEEAAWRTRDQDTGSAGGSQEAGTRPDGRAVGGPVRMERTPDERVDDDMQILLNGPRADVRGERRHGDDGGAGRAAQLRRTASAGASCRPSASIRSVVTQTMSAKAPCQGGHITI